MQIVLEEQTDKWEMIKRKIKRSKVRERRREMGEKDGEKVLW
jgi:hypothetical protein